MLVELHTLGHCLVAIGDERLGPQSPFAFALALYLGVERGRPHPREQLLPLFFPGAPEANAAHSLRQTLYKLRQLGFPAETTPAGTMVAATDVRDDYTRLLATGELPDAPATQLPGEFLPGFWPRVSDEYTRWLEGQRDAVNGALRRAYVSRILDRRAVARWDEVERYARACLAIDPLNEEATLALAEALALSGSKAAGVKVLDRYMEEVGVTDARLTLPASVLRKRIAERVPPRPDVGSPTVTVGRDEELRTLAAVAADARAGFSGSAMIWGEAGIGKTRVLRSFLATFRLTGTRIVEVQCQPHDLRRPMSLVVDLAPQLLRFAGALGADPRSVQVLRRLHTVDIGDTSMQIAAAGASPDETMSVVTEALSDVLDAITAEGFTAILVEDLHWADTASRRILGHLLSESKQRALLWIVTSRDSLATLVSTGTPTLLPLSGLPRAEGQLFVDSLIAKEARGGMSEAVPGRILDLAGGNPFYIQALCTYYNAHGSLDGTPPVLRSLIMQRLATLRPMERTVLSTCAVLGRHASISRVVAVVEMPIHQLADSLAALEDLRLIDPQGGRLAVQHALIASSLFEHESAARLAAIRRSAAQLLESEALDSSQIALVWEAADLWALCGEGDRAKRALMTSAIHAAQIGAAKEAIDAMERYAAVSTAAEVSALSERIRSIVMHETRNNYLVVDRWQDGIAKSESSRYAAELELLTMEIRRHYQSDGEQHLEELVAKVEDPTVDIAMRIRAASMAMCVADDIDDRDTANRLMAALDLAHRGLDDSDPDAVRVWLVYHTGFGDRAKAVSLARRIANWPYRMLSAGEAMRSTINAGICLGTCGDIGLARTVLMNAYRIARREGSFGHAAVAAAHSHWMARHAADREATAKWTHALEDIRKRTYLNPVDTTGLYNLALNSLESQNPQSAACYIDEIKSRVTFYSKSSHWAMFTGLQLRLDHLTGGSSVSPDDCDLAMAWSMRTASRTTEDDLALSIYLSKSRSSTAAADEYLRSYITTRRHCYPVLPSLKEISAARL